MALGYSSRNGRQVRLLAIHSAEGSRTVESLYRFFNEQRTGSSHAGADGYKLADGWVPPQYASWTLLTGNPISMNIELCGFARWSRAQWLSTGTVDGVVNPRQMIRHAAQWVDRWARHFGIPIVKLSPADVRAGKSGIVGHVDWTIGMSDGDHTDPGPNFPWDVLISDVLALRGQASGEGEDEMTPDEYLTQIEWRRYADNRNNVDRDIERTNRAIAMDDKLTALRDQNLRIEAALARTNELLAKAATSLAILVERSTPPAETPESDA